MKNTLLALTLLFLGFALVDCTEYFEANSDDILVDEDYISTTNELFSGFMGIASKVQAVADQGIILSGLRSDFLVPTSNASQDLWDIYYFNEQQDNPYISPKGYYDIIVNANNFINKAYVFSEANTGVVEPVLFDGLISGAIRYKVWAYLMLGKIYDEVAYFDDNLVEVKDVSNFEKYRLTGTLVSKLIELMIQGMPLENGGQSTNGQHRILWDALIYPDDAPVQDKVWAMICPEKEPLMTELYLWNQQYELAVQEGFGYLKEVTARDILLYMLSVDDHDNEWREFWQVEPPGEKDKEIINVVPYDYQRNQTNSLLTHFSNLGTGQYLLKPSEVAVNRFKTQLRPGFTVGDVYRGEERTYGEEDGQTVVKKYTLGRDNEIYKNDAHIILYRAADLHLWLAEALAQMEIDAGDDLPYHKLGEAQALINNGGAVFLPSQDTLLYPFDDPALELAFRTNVGVRDRVDLSPVFPSGVSLQDIRQETNSDLQRAMIADYRRQLDSLILEETCLESAAEARSHPAMVRHAIRYQNPAILADRVSAKYEVGEREAIRTRLMDQRNWFIKYDLQSLNDAD